MSAVDSICRNNHDPQFRKAIQEAYDAGRSSMQVEMELLINEVGEAIDYLDCRHSALPILEAALSEAKQSRGKTGE